MQSHQLFDHVEYVPVSAIKPSANNARLHTAEQEILVARSMKRFGVIVPLVVDEGLNLISGHCRLGAAKRLRMDNVPVLRVSHLSDADREAFAIADNRLAEKASWSNDRLASTFIKLEKLGYDMEVMGFELPEIEMIVTGVEESRPDAPEKVDALPEIDAEPVTRSGDLWILGRHMLYCGDAKEPASFDRLMWGQKADVLFTDAPYNEAADSISGLGRVRHEDFIEAAGEMTSAEFVRFLQTTLGNAAFCCRDGAIAFTFMDWRHMSEMLQAGILLANGSEECLRALLGRFGQYLLRGAGLDDSSAVHKHDPIGHLPRKADLVSYDNHREPTPGELSHDL